MKKITSISLILLFALSAFQCNNKILNPDGILKGKLVIKEICSHFVVQVTNGNLDTSVVANNWKDEKRNKTYNNVFTVSNRCGFAAANLNEGDEFEFRIDKNPPPEDCIVCMAYYETPPKRNAIRIVKPGE
ncbi:MAG TPA: hypothetical protein VGD17_13015 [Chitinophagaceae bacterium]